MREDGAYLWIYRQNGGSSAGVVENSEGRRQKAEWEKTAQGRDVILGVPSFAVLRARSSVG